jgi:hypothetical protein
MTNVNTTATEVAPLGGAGNDGFKVGYIDAVTKTLQNDTITVTNAGAIKRAVLQISTTGVAEANTVTGTTNVITCTSTTTTATISGFIYYRS